MLYFGNILGMGIGYELPIAIGKRGTLHKRESGIAIELVEITDIASTTYFREYSRTFYLYEIVVGKDSGYTLEGIDFRIETTRSGVQNCFLAITLVFVISMKCATLAHDCEVDCSKSGIEKRTRSSER